MTSPLAVSFVEDRSARVLGRLSDHDGSGVATGVDGEGNWVKQADLDSITYSVIDTSDESKIVDEDTVSLASILDVPVEGKSATWKADRVGYNFKHDIPNTAFPTGDATYQVEYTFNFSDGRKGSGLVRGVAQNRFAG